jgi:hypothetical protein
LHRGTLVPIVAGVFAILVAAPVLASATSGAGAPPASAGTSSTGTSGVRAKEWWLPDLSATQAWRTSKGAGVTVAVLSTGVSATQPDLAGIVITGPDYTGSGRYSSGPYWGGVGTAVASIIAGHGHGDGDNSGIIGIAPQARILSVRVTLEYNDPLNATSAITERLPSAIASGIVYAVGHGAKVIDLPLDPGTFGLAADGAAGGGSPAERSAVRYALDKGVVLIAPSGDNGSTSGQATYPARYPGVLAVGATGRNGQLASFSSRGSYVSLTAPGVDLMTATMLPSQSYGYAPGYAPISTTSAASAMVAGVAALVVSEYPQLSVDQVERVLRSSAAGGTEVNAARALSVAATLAPHAKTAPAPAPAPVKPHHATSPTLNHASTPARANPPRATSGMLASAVLRDAVLGVCGLVVLVAAVLLITQARRGRGRAADAAAKSGPGAGPAGRGLHEQRRGHDAADGTAGKGAGAWAGRGAGPPAGQGAGAWAGQESGIRTGQEAGAWAGAATRNDPLAASPLAAGWPPASGWQGSSEIAHSPAGSRQPLLAPAPKSMQPRSADAGAPSPPWSPAARPDGLDNPAPVMPSGWPPAGAFEGPDLTAPFAGRDVLSQSSFGFAAAPTPADLPVPTEVFPVVIGPATDFPADQETEPAAGWPADEATDQPSDPA